MVGTMISEIDCAYIAGLFDGEGSIHIRRGIEKKKKHKGKPGYRLSNSMRISMEITSQYGKNLAIISQYGKVRIINY